MFNPAKVNRHPKQGQTVFSFSKRKVKSKSLKRWVKTPLASTTRERTPKSQTFIWVWGAELVIND
jgi:hypothetical protein